MYFDVIQSIAHTLEGLNGICEKAGAYADHKKFDVAVLLSARLAPDMFDFTRQVQIATDNAKGTAARLAGQTAPKYEDNEKTLAQLKERIQRTLAYVRTFKADDFKNADHQKITLPFMPDVQFEGRDYLTQFALPNFYFHVTTAYAILRNNGVDIGKGDYIGHVPFKKK